MYQLEVKRWLVFHRFPPEEGWDVTVDVDAMERGLCGQQPPGKRDVAVACEDWLRTNGVKIGRHRLYGRADLVAGKQGEPTFIVEVEGESARQREQALYSALGQIVLAMRELSADVAYALAVPDSAEWEVQLKKVPPTVRNALHLELWLVSQNGVRCLDCAETVAALRVALEEEAQGESRPAREALAEIRQKSAIPI